MIVLQKSPVSGGFIAVTRFPSRTTRRSTQLAPALTKSSLMPG